MVPTRDDRPVRRASSPLRILAPLPPAVVPSAALQPGKTLLPLGPACSVVVCVDDRGPGRVGRPSRLPVSHPSSRSSPLRPRPCLLEIAPPSLRPFRFLDDTTRKISLRKDARLVAGAGSVTSWPDTLPESKHREAYHPRLRHTLDLAQVSDSAQCPIDSLWRAGLADGRWGASSDSEGAMRRACAPGL